MIALYIILGILLFFFLLTVFPVGFDISFQEQFSLTLRYLFLKLPILPGKEKPKKEEKPEKEEEKPEEKKKTGGGAKKIKALLKQEGFFGFLNALFDLVKMAAGAGKSIVSKIRFKRFDLYLCLGGAEDAAAAAILYGQVSAGVYSACGVLFGLTNCRKKAVTVDLDYRSGENRVDFSARLSILPLFVIKEALSLLIHSLPFLKMFLRAGRQSPKERMTGNE